MNNEDRLDLLADLIEPAAKIFGDKRVSVLAQSGNIPKAVRVAIKAHKDAVVELLARLEGKNPDEYIVPMPIVLAVKLVNLLNDPELQVLFTSAEQNDPAVSSGSATENIKDGAQ